MTTILRKYHSVARCTLLGEMIEDTAARYYYRQRANNELTFVDKQSPAIQFPGWVYPNSVQSAVGMARVERKLLKNLKDLSILGQRPEQPALAS